MKDTVRSRKIIVNEIVNRYEGRVLEVGCALASLIDKNGVVGLDVLPANRDLFCQGEAELMPFKDKSFKVVVAGELIEHLFNPARFLRECYRVLKNKGMLIITTPNRKSWVERIFKLSHPEGNRISILRKIVTSRQFKRVVGYQSIAPPEYEPFGHKRIFDKEELFGLCCQEGLFSSRDFLTTLYFGWNSKVGVIVSKFKRLAHSVLPQSLHESMILVLRKCDRETKE